MGVICLYNSSRSSSLKAQPKAKGLKVFCHSDLWGIFYLNTKSEGCTSPTSKQTRVLISNLFLALFLMVPRYFRHRDLFEGETQKISLQIMNTVQRDVGKPSWSLQFCKVQCIYHLKSGVGIELGNSFTLYFLVLVKNYEGASVSSSVHSNWKKWKNRNEITTKSPI